MKKWLKIFVSIVIMITVQAETFFIDPSENAVEHNNYGQFYFKLEDYPAAIQEFKMAIALSPNAASTASFYNNLGLVYLRIHRYNWAISCFNTSISKSPNFLEYYKNLVIAYKGQKLLGSITNRYTKYLNKDKSDYIAWLMLGLIYKEQKKNNEAIKCFNEFIRQEPDELLGSAVGNLINTMH